MYTYGWQRAETLGALVNGVFLVALCLSIFLEAIQRFVEPQEVSHPQIVLIVGCFGLASNILGLFLFHEHGHSHGGGEEHKHEHANGKDQLSAAEEGHGMIPQDEVAADEGGNIADVLPQNRLAGWPQTKGTDKKTRAVNFTQSDEDTSTATEVSSHKPSSPDSRRIRHRSRSRSRGYSIVEDSRGFVHPASFRNEIIAASRQQTGADEDSSTATESEGDDAAVVETGSNDHQPATETSPLLHSKKQGTGKSISAVRRRMSTTHKEHHHAQPKQSSGGGHGHGHSHGDLNMRGVFLHVMGDALGNIGVIASALIIWLTDYSWRFYSDPLISLIITVIILGSAIPLCKAASRILLQAVPSHIDVGEIEDDIVALPGVIDCHHLHVWQLSDNKLIASVHVQVDFPVENDKSGQYMKLAKQVRTCLHEYGIHSSTIQPEFSLEKIHRHPHGSNGQADGSAGARGDRPSSKKDKQTAQDECCDSPSRQCLLECGDDCAPAKQCCPAPERKGGDGDDHDHDHDHHH